MPSKNLYPNDYSSSKEYLLYSLGKLGYSLDNYINAVLKKKEVHVHDFIRVLYTIKQHNPKFDVNPYIGK